MESGTTYWTDRSLLEWQVELGALDAIQDTPVDRYALEAVKAKPKPALPPVTATVTAPETQSKAMPTPATAAAAPDVVAEARHVAEAAHDLTQLRQSVETFTHCDLRKGARSSVFASGNPAARLMLVGDAPNRAEDRAGVPFVGEEGQLLDKMLDAIGLARQTDDLTQAVYVAAPLPWRTPSDGPPGADDAAMMAPFLERHIMLADPAVVVLMGNTGLQMLTGQGGLTRRRGLWLDLAGKPALPMFHPAHLLRNTAAKREAWADLLTLKSKLKDLT